MPESIQNEGVNESVDEPVVSASEDSESKDTGQEGDNKSEESEPVGQTETDDWAAAMAEQSASEVETETGVVAGTNETAPVFEQFSEGGGLANTHNDIDMILDIPVQLTVELGRTKIAIKNLLQLAQGSVVELDGMAGEPMDVLVNGCLIAQGEVVVVNDKFGIRLTDIITPSERIRKLNR